MGPAVRSGARLAGALREEPHQGVLPPRQEGITEVKGGRQGAGPEDVRGVGRENPGKEVPKKRVGEAAAHIDELAGAEG